MLKLIGEKTKRIYDEFISNYIPNDIENYIYVEPFGGTFAINTFLPKRPKLSVYNDINKYDFFDKIIADKKYILNFHKIIDDYDSENTFFYLDPPYYGKELLYNGMEMNNDDFFHIVIKNAISDIKGKFIISYEKNVFIEKLYKNFNIFYYNGNFTPLRNEMIITNINVKQFRKNKLNEIAKFKK